jgi:hypothetical protein
MRNILSFVFAFALILASASTVTFAQQPTPGARALPEGAHAMSQQELADRLSNLGLASKTAGGNVEAAMTVGLSPMPASSALIVFIPEGSTVSGGLSIFATNAAAMPEGTFVWLTLTNPYQPSQFEGGTYFGYTVSPGGLWLPVELERKEKYSENAGLANYLVSVYMPGVGVQTFRLDKTIKKYATNAATPHFIVDGYDSGGGAIVLLGNFAPGKPGVVLKDTEAYRTNTVDQTAIENFGGALVVYLYRDANLSGLPAADYVVGVTTSDGRADSFTLRFGARNFGGVGTPNPGATAPAFKTTDKAVPVGTPANLVPQAVMFVNLPRDWDTDKDADKNKEQTEKDKEKGQKTNDKIPSRPQPQ